MEAKLKFCLPEEQQEFDFAYNGHRYHHALFELRNRFRSWSKMEKEPTYDQIKEEFYSLLEQIKFE